MGIEDLPTRDTEAMTVIHLTAGPAMEVAVPIEDVMLAAHERHSAGDELWIMARRHGAEGGYRGAVVYPGTIVMLESLESED